ncbi:hypothetical protein AB0H83_21670 [Dactylosporangium sp. NPDC050688]|uniref:hypothetical protein n=1 Tax=Dactylosporangium sp. NPDC050688 TaxID=3157217 RepID=UPI0033FABF4B
MDRMPMSQRIGELGRRIARGLVYGCFVSAGVSTLAQVVSLLTGRPRFAGWPWTTGVIIVLLISGYALGRLRGSGTSNADKSPGRSRSPIEPSMEAAEQMARSGQRIQAVKMVRQLTGLSLEAALAVVRKMEERGKLERP